MNDDITTNAGENSEAVENTKAGGGEAVDINDIGVSFILEKHVPIRERSVSEKF